MEANSYETSISTQYLDKLISRATRIVELDSGEVPPERELENWLTEVQQIDVIERVRVRLLVRLWNEWNLLSTLKAIRLLKDPQLADMLIDQSNVVSKGHLPTRLADISDRKEQLILLSLTYIEHPIAHKLMKAIEPPGMVYVPPGEFTMGNDDDTSLPDETPKHRLWLSGFYIDRFTSGMAEYRNFLIEGGYEIGEYWTPAGWQWCQEIGAIAESRWQMLTDVPSDIFPVHWINWYEAMAFAKWSGASLPTEAQWEKAARGTDSRVFPWGNDFDENLCSTDALGLTGPTKPGYYSPKGDSPYGIADMAGNCLEWVTSLYKPYPFREDDGREDPDATGQRIHRGGAWSNPPYVATTYRRVPNNPQDIHVDHGIRLAQSPYHVFLVK